MIVVICVRTCVIALRVGRDQCSPEQRPLSYGAEASLGRSTDTDRQEEPERSGFSRGVEGWRGGGVEEWRRVEVL